MCTRKGVVGRNFWDTIMGDKTGIQWTDATWNPLRGCSRVSKGCEHCYAETVAHRFSGPGAPFEGLITVGKKGPRWNGNIMLVPEKLKQPLRWTRERMVFVNSMSDLFHENVSFDYIAAVFGVMAEAKTHTFQVLTKRPQRAKEFFQWLHGAAFGNSCADDAFLPYKQYEVGICLDKAAALTKHPKLHHKKFPKWPLENVWLGVSAEDQKTADTRVPILLECPAAVHWVSYEPALGPVNFGPWVNDLHWIVVGGESGAGSRPFDWRWAQNVVLSCHKTNTKVFVKQLGTKPIMKGSGMPKPKKYKGSDMAEWPQVIQVREYPK